MLDSITVISIVAAGIIAWVFCLMNPRVFFVWKLVAPFAMLFPVLFVGFALTGNEIRMVLWSGIRVDWLTIGCALAPIIVWPIRPDPAKKLAAVRVAGTA